VLGTAVLVCSVEAAVAHRGVALTPTDARCWRITAGLLDRHAAESGLLCLGDSLVKFGVYPRAIERLTGRPAYNLAVNMGPTPLTYFFLRRALERGARPSAVLIDSGDFCLPKGPAWGTAALRYSWADALTLAETAELCSSARDHCLFARIALEKALPSLSWRHPIRAAVVAALGGTETTLRTVNLTLARNLMVNAGAQVNDNSSYRPEEPDPPPGVAGGGTFTPDPVNVFYLRRAFRLAKERGVTVYWLVPPVHPHHQALLHHYGDEDRMTRFIRRVHARHPEVVVVDGRGTGFGGRLFLDPAHLNRDGALAYTASLADLLTRDSSVPFPPGTWLTLAGPGAAPAGVPFEDTARSREIARAADAATRR
jgi:hypothetical protein